MPVDEIAEALFHFIGRFIMEIFVEIIFQVVCHLIGMIFLRFVTLGVYPPRDKPYSEDFVSTVGMFILIGTIVGAIFLFKTYVSLGVASIFTYGSLT
jgi:hypothetical protein